MYTVEAEGKIRDHNKEKPLFLYLAYQAVHSANRQGALQALQEWINKLQNIKHPQRQIYAAMVAYMEYGIGRVNLLPSSHMGNTEFLKQFCMNNA